VVIGDQSCGKSSVLEGITKVPFQVGDELCTRFATEVSLHNSSSDDITSMSISVRIDEEHSQEYSEEHQQRIYEWESRNSPITGRLDPRAFRRILKDARFPSSGVFCYVLISKASDVILGDRRLDSGILSHVTLCINQTGPNEPDLTIIDLPGLVCGKQF
jgi:hypothetical protein